MISVIIPAREEAYLERTIQSVLESAIGDVEVIVVLDGWKPELNITDERVKLIPLSESVGQRAAINIGASCASGKFVMKLDAHCSLDKGWDVVLSNDCEYDMTMIPRMRNLDVSLWEPRYLSDWRQALRKRKVHDYMYIGWDEKGEFRTLYYPHEINKQWHARTELVDETMSCMGCCFFMHRERFWELEGCDEKHGSFGQQGIEVALKAWLSGGRLMVNKKTWFAHWFRGGGGPGFPYKISQRDIDKAREYSKDLWLNDKWHLAVKPLSWVLDKFNPPTWEGRCYGKDKNALSVC